MLLTWNNYRIFAVDIDQNIYAIFIGVDNEIK